MTGLFVKSSQWFLSETRPNHAAGTIFQSQRPDLLMINVFSTIKLMGNTLESTGLIVESSWTRQMWFRVFHFGHDFDDFGLIFVLQDSFEQIQRVFHRKMISSVFKGMSLVILRRGDAWKSLTGFKIPPNRSIILAQNGDVEQSNIFVWRKFFSSVMKIFSEIFGIFSKNQQNSKEKSSRNHQISKFFACGGIKIVFCNVLWTKLD